MTNDPTTFNQEYYSDLSVTGKNTSKVLRGPPCFQNVCAHEWSRGHVSICVGVLQVWDIWRTPVYSRNIEDTLTVSRKRFIQKFTRLIYRGVFPSCDGTGNTRVRFKVRGLVFHHQSPNYLWYLKIFCKPFLDFSWVVVIIITTMQRFFFIFN